MDALLDNPAALAAAAVVLVGLLLVLRRSRAGGDRREEAVPGVEALLAKGRYDEAATLALEAGRQREAVDILLRGQLTARAAMVAMRLGDLRQAAELYARAEDWERAALCYEKAGLTGAAQEARAKLKAAAAVAAPSPRDANAAEARARELAAGGSEADLAEAQLLAQRAAEEHLSAGDIERAARVYREAGLLDEAIHLYANVLGLPGEAAPLVARLGNPSRAAELFEVAGMPAKAAGLWAEVARGDRKPERLIQRIIDLDPDAAFALLDELVRARVAVRENVEVHYHFAVMLADRGEVERARGTFQSIQRELGSFRDVDDRLRGLRARPSPEPAAAADGAEKVQVVLQPVFVGDGEVIDVERIAHEAATAASKRARRSSLRPPAPDALPATRVEVAVTSPVRAAVYVPGLEQRPLQITLLGDVAVRDAKEGPSIAALERFLTGRSCDLGNIEVFYRLGLAHLAGGDWASALRCFDEVEEASPGYRDAGLRASEVRAWRGAMGERLTLDGAAAGTAGRYELRGELGRGGMAVVYRAVDTVLGREVALKFLNAESSGSAELREMFQREARSVAQLNHSNIVTVYDFGTYEGRAFLAMEYVEGATVDQLVQTEGRLSVVEALRVTQQVLAALEYAHRRSIIHRDVKPSNMMRAASGVVKLMDFGLAKSIAQGSKASVIAGTPAYMPPEQFVGRGVDHRADLFATAASLYEMLTGDLPFATLDHSVRPKSVRASHPAVPEIIDRVLQIGLEAEPGKRFQSAAEFAAPIQRVLGAIERGSMRPAAPPAPEAMEVILTLPPPSAALAGLVPQTERHPAGGARGATVRFGGPQGE